MDPALVVAGEQVGGSRADDHAGGLAPRKLRHLSSGDLAERSARHRQHNGIASRRTIDRSQITQHDDHDIRMPVATPIEGGSDSDPID